MLFSPLHEILTAKSWYSTSHKLTAKPQAVNMQHTGIVSISFRQLLVWLLKYKEVYTTTTSTIMAAMLTGTWPPSRHLDLEAIWRRPDAMRRSCLIRNLQQLGLVLIVGSDALGLALVSWVSSTSVSGLNASCTFLDLLQQLPPPAARGLWETPWRTGNK